MFSKRLETSRYPQSAAKLSSPAATDAKARRPRPGISSRQCEGSFAGQSMLSTSRKNRQRLAQEAASFLIPEPQSNVHSRPQSSGAAGASENEENQRSKGKVVGEAGLEPAKA
jgi:hypothetical protein